MYSVGLQGELGGNILIGVESLDIVIFSYEPYPALPTAAKSRYAEREMYTRI
jgi:hypothetical protein